MKQLYGFLESLSLKEIRSTVIKNEELEICDDINFFRSVCICFPVVFTNS